MCANHVIILHLTGKSRRVRSGKKERLSSENKAVKKCSEMAFLGKEVYSGASLSCT